LSTVTFLSPVTEEIKLVEERMRAQADEHHPDLRAALEHLLAAGGKRIRPTLGLLIGNMLDAPLEKLVTLGAAVELLHTATLVHDDLIDGSLLRRGTPTLNARWSPPATVLTGDFLFARAAKLAADTDHLPLMKLFSETLATIVNGELTQMFTSRGLINRDNYEKRIYAKTASLFCAATQGAAVLARLPEERIADLYQFGYNFGMAFQIVDDILDFIGDETTLGKPAGSDLRQGTLTLPFFHYLHQHSDASSVIAILEAAQVEADNGDGAAWHEAVTGLVQDLRAGGAVEAAREEARIFLRRAVDNLAALPDSFYRHSLQGLCEFVVRRTY